MQFKKYSSIENSYRQKEIQSIKLNFPEALFIVQEKVHGANFSFWTDGENVKCAKRTGFIKDNENFYDYEIVLDKYGDKIIEMFKGLKKEKYLDDNLQELVVYGEIYGGNYPHPNVEAKTVKTVQKGVYYSNDVDFIAFDIKANGVYIPFKKFKASCMVGQIPFLDAIAEGTLDECLAISNEYPTTIPKMHGLPEIENNMCEGNVIRPLDVLYFDNGSRVILKNKNTKFAEKKRNKSKLKPSKEVPEYVKSLQIDGVRYINENRLRNVISKIGTVTQKDFGKVLGLLSKDVVEDFEKDNELVGQLETQDRKMLTKFLNNECGSLIRANFINIVDGNF